VSNRIAVIGGGYAGFAAAVTLAGAGRAVTLFEAARTLGGRARRVEACGTTVDNGAHILLGAYRGTLSLMRLVHGSRPESDLLERRRLALEQPGVFQLRAAGLPAPWHLAAALFTMRGVSRGDRLAAVAFVRRLGQDGFRCAPELSVAALLADSPPRVTSLLWEPLCIAALNTPIETASAQIFLNVMRLAFAAHARDSDLLIPRVDLSTLFPDAAAAYVAERRGEIRSGSTVRSVVGDGAGVAVRSGVGEYEHFVAGAAMGREHVQPSVFKRLRTCRRDSGSHVGLEEGSAHTSQPSIVPFAKRL